MKQRMLEWISNGSTLKWRVKKNPFVYYDMKNCIMPREPIINWLVRAWNSSTTTTNGQKNSTEIYKNYDYMTNRPLHQNGYSIRPNEAHKWNSFRAYERMMEKIWCCADKYLSKWMKQAWKLMGKLREYLI